MEVQTSENTAKTGVGRSHEWVCAIVNVQHQRVRALNEHLDIALDSALNEGNLVNDIRLQALTVGVEAGDLILDIVLEQVAITLLEAIGKVAELLVEALLVEDIGNADTAAGSLCGVCWANALAGRANVGISKFHLLKAVNLTVEVKINVAAVADEDAVLGLDAVLLKSVNLVEKVGNVDNAAGANQVDATLGQDARGCGSVSLSSSSSDVLLLLTQDVHVESGSVFHNGVT